MTPEMIDRAAGWIAMADALVVAAGAGMGVDSGLPDFRGPEGFWRAYPAYKDLGLRFEEMASPGHFARDPALGWGFYGHRQNLYRATEPHAGFGILRRWAEAKPRGHFVFTSNVDDHFGRAGFDRQRVVEVHGAIEHGASASSVAVEPIFPADAADVAVDPITFRAARPFPACPGCGDLARPNILMFGDWRWDSARTDAQFRRLATWFETLEGARVAVVELGAGMAIPTVRRFSEQLVVDLGAKLIRINVREADVPRGQVGLDGPALATLRALDDRLGRASGETRLEPG